jgi:hypothetical protein
MSEWAIRHGDGSVLKDEAGNEVTTGNLEYSGAWMGECFVSVTFKNAVPILFRIGDFLTYRGEVFEINYDPGKIKQSRRGEYGEAFVYENVKFNAKQDELARTEFLDIVLHDNQIHYTSLTKFAFYVSSPDDLLDRIQANLDEQWGEGAWKIYSRNRLRSGQRGCDLSVWDKTYGSGIADNVIDSTSITADGLNCWNALALINSQFDINFITRGRNVFVGTAGLPTSHIFKYGRGNGLYQIEQNADSEQAVTTRLRAYGSTKNLPNRYYATLHLQVSAAVKAVEGELYVSPDGRQANVSVELALPFSVSYFTGASIGTGSDVDRPCYVVPVTCNGAKAVVRAFKSLNSANTILQCDHSDTPLYYYEANSLEDVKRFAANAKEGAKIIFTSSVNKEKFPRENRDYATANLPDNMAVDRLMLPGFPNKSLKQWWDEQTEETKRRIYQGDKSHLFSESKYRPYVDSANVKEIGVRPNSVYFDSKDVQQGIEDIYPTIEKMEIGGIRIDEVESADTIEDNGVFKDGSTIPNFHIRLKAAIDFDLNDLIGNSTEQPTISMKDGMCGGRTFQIGSVNKQKDGSWELTCQRVKDESLDLYFPYNDYQVKTGDHFVLLGIPLPDSYVEAASMKLLKYALSYLDRNDYTRYVYSPKIDDVYMQRQHDMAVADTTHALISLHDTIKEGDIMQFDDSDLRIEGKVSIDQLVIREEEGKIPSYEVTLREDKSVGTIQKIQERISSIESGNGGAGGGGGLTVPQVQRLIETHGGRHFLDRLHPDTARELITFLKGIAVGDGCGIDGKGNANLLDIIASAVKSRDFHSGLLDGTGFGIYEDEHGKSVAEVDKLEVRQKATFAELEYRRLAFTTGDVGYTSAGGRIAFVKKTGNAYRCYFLADDGEKRVANEWRVGDMATCRTTNLLSRTTKQAADRYYWRLVVNTGEETTGGKLYYFIDLSDIRGSLDLTTIDGKKHACVGMDTSTENDVPQAEDDIIQLGSQTDPDRQYAYILYVSEGKRVDYAGINDYDLTRHIVNEFSPRGTTIRSDSFKVISGAGTGTSAPIVCDRGEWTGGTVAGHYDRFSYRGSLWLCTVGAGKTTTEEPSEKSMVWLRQVAQGADGAQGAAPVMLDIYSDGGNFIRNGQGTVTLTAVVTKANVDITGTFPPACFSWLRHSGNAAYDEAWNNRHKGAGPVVTVGAEDVDKRTVFECVLDD